ncbi:hypothetical protein GGX14DRAFT_467767 [Mycena pura]|uniref:Uncharacterized protein n=1 Tax=Mycena pura TaxID=153505 RepID=A0AAD6V4P6_9AGAR|nr:hypothetical protein GGX14DRAFT_467767 [Mycena pura]
MFAPAWWMSVVQGAVAHRRSAGLSLPSRFLALDFAGFVLTFVGLYAVEAVAGDVPAGFGTASMVWRLAVSGPASTMAAYYEAKEWQSIEAATEGQKKRG